MTAEPDTRDQFERTLRQRDGRTLIESRCKRCGAILLGSAIFDDLQGQEQRHAARCRETGTQTGPEVARTAGQTAGLTAKSGAETTPK